MKIWSFERGAKLGALVALASVLATTVSLPAHAEQHASHPSLAGVWVMDHYGYRSSMEFTARERVAMDIDGHPAPLQPWAQAILETRLKDADDGKIFANNAAKCLPQGVPYIVFGAVDGPIQILESPGQITLVSTEMSENWFIYVGAKHPQNFYPNYHGDSVAHWEGNVLVIDTIGLSGDKTPIDQVGTPHTDDLHVVTRVRKVDPDTLEFRVTYDDKKTFTRPWERKVIYHRAAPGTRIDEYVCEADRNAPDEHGFQTFRSTSPQ